MNDTQVNITNVELKNAVFSKVSSVESIASCIGIDYSYENREWRPLCDTMMDVCHGIMNNTSLFVACNTPNDIGDGKIYIFRNYTLIGDNPTPITINVPGHMIFKVFIYENFIVAITTEGKILKVSGDNDNAMTVEEVEFPEKAIDAIILSNKLWILSPTKLYEINGTFNTINATDPYPDGIDMQSLVPAVGGDNIIIYANTEQLPMFIRYQITENKFSVFSSSTPFTIVSAILIGTEVPTLYVYATDTKVRTLTLSDNIGFFDFNVYRGYQWVGECTYYDGYIYNQYLDLTSGSPKLFLARSINGVIFQIVTEEFDYCDVMYGKYCQGDGQSVFISPTLYHIRTPYISGIDYSRYCDMIEVKDVPCNGQSDLHSMIFDVSDTELARARLIDEASLFVNLKIRGKSTASTKIEKILRNFKDDGDMYITVYTGNPNMSNIEEFSDITADFVAKRIL